LNVRLKSHLRTTDLSVHLLCSTARGSSPGRRLSTRANTTTHRETSLSGTRQDARPPVEIEMPMGHGDIKGTLVLGGTGRLSMHDKRFASVLSRDELR
jgi:hypothetical protein